MSKWGRLIVFSAVDHKDALPLILLNCQVPTPVGRRP